MLTLPWSIFGRRQQRAITQGSSMLATIYSHAPQCAHASIAMPTPALVAAPSASPPGMADALYAIMKQMG